MPFKKGEIPQEQISWKKGKVATLKGSQENLLLN